AAKVGRGCCASAVAHYKNLFVILVRFKNNVSQPAYLVCIQPFNNRGHAEQVSFRGYCRCEMAYLVQNKMDTVVLKLKLQFLQPFTCQRFPNASSAPRIATYKEKSPAA